METFGWGGKVCAITGGANGIGRATALFAARTGCHVHLLDRSADAAHRTANEIVQSGGAADWHEVDITDEASVDSTMARIVERHRRLDVLVNSAGIAIRQAATELPVTDWNKVLDVNITGSFLCARSAARHMMPQRSGAIINLASIMGLSGGLYPNISYMTTKGAVVNLTRALAVEWAPHGIRVNAVAPTWVRTDFIKPVLDNVSMMKRIAAVTPLGRIAEPDEVAGAIVFLGSPAASMITGHILAVDGGFLAQ